uniref:Contactin associated protein family member 5 n=1 Tax=Latimeria chalumnae TaxID=7897 RepID=H3ADF6_LATCH
WLSYHSELILKAFTGNTNADSVVPHKFQHSIKARFLRFVPLVWNPNGRIGMRVEVYGCSYKSDVADFDGRSSLLYRFNQKSMSTVKDVISLKFKSMQGDGVLLHGEGQRGDYITLELRRGKLLLHISLGDNKLRSSNSHTSISLGSLLDDQHWHSVLIERFNKQVNFTVDKHTQHFRVKGESDYLNIDYELSFGGIPVPGKPGAFLKKNFHGCIENLYYNGINIIDLAKRRKPQIYTVGNVTFLCSEPQVVPITFLSSSSSYLLLPDSPQIDGLSVSFQFRTWNRDGLLLSTQLYENLGTLLVYLTDGTLKLVHQKSTKGHDELSTGTNLNDGLWHSVSLIGRRHRISITLDNDIASSVHATTAAQIYSGTSYYFGGCPPNISDSGCVNPISAFQGCMRLIFIDSQPKDLSLVQQGTLGNFSDLQIDLCGIRDRCLPNYCEHSGECSQSWNTFYCDCTGTGYTGATCHDSIYEQSCEAYRHMGNASDFYFIDSDGSGPLDPIRVFCNMTEDKVWTVMYHNNTEVNRVRGSNLEKPYSMHFSYSSGSMEQLQAVINSAEQCNQETSYHCKKSRLLNTPNGEPFTWWVGRTNEKQTYWGGSIPGIQQCACGFEENCIDVRYFCNCDADKEEWTNDTGLLSYKDHLPVTQIVIGDTNRKNSEAAFRIGPLRCYGDRNFWNAASFNTEASYLHFPTFHAELSADISFFFKTTTSTGVFLENLGIKDYIQVELRSPTEVVFSFDVGNGPFEVSVKSPTPLNDNQWHYVRAERNVKEASLLVDQFPERKKETPSDGHFRLQLNSQLFVGRCTAREKSFCNGLRSMFTAFIKYSTGRGTGVWRGVGPGCPGHCSSYGKLCHNGGKCIERHNDYVCDCSSSAYDGPFCKKEVSAFFENGTSVTYFLPEPYPVTRNLSSQSSAIYADAVQPRENVAFDFKTVHVPSLLFYVSSHHQEYMAVILSKNGSLEVQYKTNRKQDPYAFLIDSASFADGQLHRVKINREGRELYVQVDQFHRVKYSLSSDTEFHVNKFLVLGKVLDSTDMDSEVMKANSRGFVGCLSSVQYNHVAPLKVALRHPSATPVNVKGRLLESNCGASVAADLNTITTTHSLSDLSGKTDEREPLANAISSDSAVIGGVIAVVIFITLCVIAIMIRLLYQHKETKKRSSETKEKGYTENLDCSLRNDIDLQNAVSECKKEYFI